MLRGSRVVRGPDWAGRDSDGGEGGLGTVTDVNVKTGKVKVVWDTGNESQAKAGHDGKFELRLYDNAPAGVKHDHITCDSCRLEPVVGLRWKCAVCTDFDLCMPCYMTNKHDTSHGFFRLDTLRTPLVTVPARKKTTVGHLHGILEGASVQRGIHWKWGNQDGGRGHAGEVLKIAKWGQNSYRGAARVKWQDGRYEYRVGGEGCVDLMSIGESQVHPYYPTHLPVFNAQGDAEFVLEPGNKVRVEVSPDVAMKLLKEMRVWNDDYKDYLKKEGTVCQITNKGHTAWLAYDDAETLLMVTSILSKVHVFSKGDIVKITANFNVFQELQRGHGGYNESMDEILGQLGRIEEIERDGDLLVKVKKRTWMLAPAVCSFVPDCKLSDSQRNATGLGPSPASAATPLSSGSSSSSTASSGSAEDEEVVAEGVERLLREFMRGGGGGGGGGVEGKASKVDALVEAAAQDDLHKVKAITASSPELVDKKMQGKTALHMACYNGLVDMVRHLLAVKANPNITDDEDDNALHHAVAGEYASVVSVLVDHKGLQLNAQNEKKRTALHMAVTTGQPDIIRILLDRGADPNTQDEDGDTPLHDALGQEDEEVWRLLLKAKKLNMDVYNKEGHNPLHRAVLEKNENAVEAMLDIKPSLSASKTKKEQCTALHIAAINCYTGIANLLLGKGRGSTNVRDQEGRTALHLAVVQRSLQMTEVLLHNSCDLNIQDNDGNTPSHLAWQRTYSNSASLSFRRRESRTDSRASIGDDHEIPYLLASRGADLVLKNKDGKTPLDYAPKPIASLLRKVSQKTSTVTDLSPPAKWVTMEGQKVKRVPLSTDDPQTKSEFDMVREAFQKSLRFKQVHEIVRIQNVDSWERYATHKRKLERQYGVGQSGERFLFHGTRPGTVELIIKQGVDFRVVARAVYGDGAYFASDAKVSDFYTERDDLQRRYMFMVKVLAGEYTVGTQGLKKPPLKKNSQDDHYDCCVDNVSHPRIFVVFDNAQCYPEYLITYE